MIEGPIDNFFDTMSRVQTKIKSINIFIYQHTTSNTYEKITNKFACHMQVANKISEIYETVV